MRRAFKDFGYYLTDRGIRAGRNPIDIVMAQSHAKNDAVVDSVHDELASADGQHVRAAIVCDFATEGNQRGRSTGPVASAVECFARVCADATTAGLHPILLILQHLHVAGADAHWIIPALEELLRDGSVEAVIDEGDSPVVLTVVALEKEPANVINVLAAYSKVEFLDPPQVDSMMAFMISLIFATLFMLSAVTFCSYVAQGVVDEKSSRIVEILLATTGARALMCGKIAGNAIVAFTCIGVAAILATTGLLVAGQDLLLGELGSALIWFVILFLLGFVLLAALYAGAASLVSRQEDVAGLTGPLMMLIMIPYVLVILFFDNTTVVLVWLSSIVYERAVMRIGKRVALKAAIKTV